VLNLINPKDGVPQAVLKDALSVAATLCAFRLAEEGRYEAPTHEELAKNFPYIRHAPNSPIARTIEQCMLYAPTGAVILLLGETGTGKELFARLIHEAAGLTGEKVDVNCSLLHPDRTEDDLFGHAKGAFTSADSERKGSFEAAAGGTVFLDEIGELAPKCQPMFLRVIESRRGRRMGDTVERHYDARVIAATKRTLSELLDQGLIREDLWERLSRFVVTIPPLRERPMDIPILAEHFIEKYSIEYNMPAPSFSKGARDRLQWYPWERNVRQLENVMARAVVHYPGMKVDETALEKLVAEPGNGSPAPVRLSFSEVPKATRMNVTEENSIRQALRAPENLLNNGRPNLSKVARALKMDRHTLPHKLHQYGIDKFSG
jgi:DNA-binding NtrC family response regulator